MKNYNLKPQEKNNYCVCSIVQAIFDFHGLIISQEEVALKLTPSKYGYRIDDLKFRDFVQDNKFKYDLYNYNTTPFNEPDSLLNENADIFITLNNHALLVKDFKDPEVKFIDPVNAGVKTERLENILSFMNRTHKGFFGLLKRI